MKWTVIPDLQCPDQDDMAVASVVEFIKHEKPDGLLCVGDEADAPEPSRWNRGYAGEYAGTLQAGLDKTHEVLALLRAALGKDKPFHLMRSNHGERIAHYIRRYAPALGSLKSLEYQQLLGLDELGITFHKQPFEFAPNWVLAHGDEGSLINTAGGSALGLAKRWGKSTIVGHTHRAGIQHHHLYLNGKPTRLLYGIEVGHLMDMRKADYLKAGSANWQQAIATVYVDGKTVVPQLHLLQNRRLIVNGRVF